MKTKTNNHSQEKQESSLGLAKWGSAKFSSPDILIHLAELKKGCNKSIQFSPFICGRFGNPITPNRSYCIGCITKLQEAQVMLKFQEQELEEDVEFLDNEIDHLEIRNSLVKDAEIDVTICNFKQKLEQKQAQLKLIKEEVSR